MSESIATISGKNQITLPAEVRRALGVGPSDKLAFVLAGDTVTVKPVKTTVASLFGSVPALRQTSADFEEEIDEAMQDEADRIVRALIS